MAKKSAKRRAKKAVKKTAKKAVKKSRGTRGGGLRGPSKK